MISQSEHRHYAVSTYSLCWELINQERTPADDRNLIGYALTSRYHWQQIGGPQELAIADWMAGRVFALTNQPKLALNFATASLEHSNRDFPAWLKASLNEGMARAHASAGNLVQRDSYVRLAYDELENETDDEDAELIREQIRDLLIPR